MTDRFDLEQQIQDCWKVVDDVELIRKAWLDGEDFDEDSLTNALLGISTLYQLKFEQLFSTFTSLVDSGDIR